MKKVINLLTVSRIIFAPMVFFCILQLEYFGIAFMLLIIASISDFLDGYLARKFELTSELGRIMDPIADKVLVAFALVAISLHLSSILIGLATSVIISRELWVSALREMNAIQGNINATKVTFLAKIKTTIQLFTLSVYLLALTLNDMLLIQFAHIFLFISLLITLYTGLVYTLNSVSDLDSKK
jgi:CDP-diacylglycerol--glycerol-3-phosphate 3-phosphatidyltransferase